MEHLTHNTDVNKTNQLNSTNKLNSTDNIKWQCFSNWVHCFCVVTFDLELGQALEAIYPPHITLSELEKSNVCYLAFPDSNSGCMGDTQFIIRLRSCSNNENESLSANQIEYNNTTLPTLHINPGYLWGFVYFRQVKDASLPRGYFQKSIVLLTRLPFVNLFSEISSLVAPEFFDNGMVSLEVACDHISQWPSLSPGEVLNLPILGSVFQTYIPNHNSYKTAVVKSSELRVNNSAQVRILSSVYELNIYQILSNVIAHTHLLWELVLTTEPIVVMASSPTLCSHMVEALISMISPLSYCADHRPYFTIHDSEFKEFTNNKQGPPSVILGVTNPFFSKTLHHWPHTINLCEGHTPMHKQKLKKTGNLKYDSLPGVYTEYKPFLQKDKMIIKKLISGVRSKRPMEVQSALLRRHLLELTQSFMIPLERYIASLMPLQKNVSPFKAAPVPQTFNPEDFLNTLTQSGPQLTSSLKGDWEGLYKRFFRSSNFNGWFNERYTNLTQKLQALQLEALADADVKQWVNGKQEVEIVDMILNIKQKLSKVQEQSMLVKSTTKQKLLQRIDDMACSLPDDLKPILL